MRSKAEMFLPGYSRLHYCFHCILYILVIGSDRACAFTTIITRPYPSSTASFAIERRSCSTSTIQRIYSPGLPAGKTRKGTCENKCIARGVRMSTDSGVREGFTGDACNEASADSSRLPNFQTFESIFTKWCDRGTSAFPIWVLAAAVLGLVRPATLSWFGGDLITAALAITMVCMGMTLRVEDFVAIARHPRPVAAGVLAQYTIMPLLGYVTARLYKLPPALAAGVTLVGCCPGGTASNLVTLIARGDVALSVSMTTVSTILAAALTGPLTKLLVGSLVNINAATLMIATTQVIFIPIALGLVLGTYAEDFTRRLSPYTPLLCVALVALVCGSVVAQSSAILLQSGAALVGAMLTLHTAGFALGYMGMRYLGFTDQQARTASIEVGMQNSALAVVLAQRGLPDPISAIPGAVSATCHSLVGSALAAFWRAKDRKARQTDS